MIVSLASWTCALVVVILKLLAIACLATAVAPGLRLKYWWVRIWDFPRPQQAVLAAAIAAALFGLAPPGPPVYTLAVLVALAARHHVAVVLPYTRLWRPQLLHTSEPPGPRSLSLLIVNVLMENRGADGLLTLIRRTDPDVVVAVETDEWWSTRLSELADERPHAVLHPLSNTYGMMLRSRLQLEAPEVRFLLHDEIPSIRTGVRLRSGELIRLYAVHPEPPSPTEAETSSGATPSLFSSAGKSPRPTSPPSLRAISTTSAGRGRVACSAGCRSSSIPGLGAACSAPSTPDRDCSAGRSTMSSSVPTFCCAKSIVCRPSAPITSRSSSRSTMHRGQWPGTNRPRLIMPTGSRRVSPWRAPRLRWRPGSLSRRRGVKPASRTVGTVQPSTSRSL